jgi:hypothetical protein
MEHEAPRGQPTLGGVHLRRHRQRSVAIFCRLPRQAPGSTRMGQRRCSPRQPLRTRASIEPFRRHLCTAVPHTSLGSKAVPSPILRKANATGSARAMTVFVCPQVAKKGGWGKKIMGATCSQNCNLMREVRDRFVLQSYECVTVQAIE